MSLTIFWFSASVALARLLFPRGNYLDD